MTLLRSAKITSLRRAHRLERGGLLNFYGSYYGGGSRRIDVDSEIEVGAGDRNTRKPRGGNDVAARVGSLHAYATCMPWGNNSYNFSRGAEVTCAAICNEPNPGSTFQKFHAILNHANYRAVRDEQRESLTPFNLSPRFPSPSSIETVVYKESLARCFFMNSKDPRRESDVYLTPNFTTFFTLVSPFMTLYFAKGRTIEGSNEISPLVCKFIPINGFFGKHANTVNEKFLSTKFPRLINMQTGLWYWRRGWIKRFPMHRMQIILR